ncbi:hypothetical protein ACRSSH_004739, partial [Yersinia enterocolitica]
DLTANLANQLCFAQAVLFFLFIKDGGEGVVGMFDIAAQVSDICCCLSVSRTVIVPSEIAA